MREKCITQYELLHRGIDNRTLDTLRKNGNMTLYTLEKICKALDCNPEEVVEFTDDEELVLQACGAEMLKKLVREIAVTSSKIGSTSMTLTDATGERSLAEVAGAKKEQMIEAVQEMKQDIMGVDDLTDLGDMDIEFDEGW